MSKVCKTSKVKSERAWNYRKILKKKLINSKLISRGKKALKLRNKMRINQC